MNIQHPKALITGAGSGIGRALALQAAAAGYHLILVGRQTEPLMETARLCGGKHHCLSADITTPEGRKAIIKACGPKLALFISNAGILSVGHLAKTDDTEIERMMAANLTAPICLTGGLLPALEAAQGQVALVGSVFGDIAYPFFAGYSASKFGLRGFAEALRREVAPKKISVTYIAPRATRTKAAQAFDLLIKPMKMQLDEAETVAAQAWKAIERRQRDAYPRSAERVFVKLQRLFPKLIDRGLRDLPQDAAVLAALKTQKGDLR